MFSNKTKILYNLRNLYVDKRGKFDSYKIFSFLKKYDKHSFIYYLNLHRYKEIKDKLVIFNNFKPCFLEHHLNLNLKLNKKNRNKKLKKKFFYLKILKISLTSKLDSEIKKKKLKNMGKYNYLLKNIKKIIRNMNNNFDFKRLLKIVKKKYQRKKKKRFFKQKEKKKSKYIKLKLKF